MNNPVNWFEIYVQDMGRAKAFYEAVFGVQLTKLDGTELEMWAFAMRQDDAGASGSLVRIPGYPSGNNSAVEDEKAANSGGQIETGKKSVGQYGHIALVIDTEGNIIGLHSAQ